MVVTVMKFASLLMWSYAAILLVCWVRAVGAQDRKTHIGFFVELMAALVPLSCAAVVLVMLGAVIGLPSVVGVLFVMLPAGVVVSLGIEVRRIEHGASDRLESLRLAASLCLAFSVIAGRGGI
ncbi:MAG: hypothetical protein QNI90_17780 [Dinoroseobacter sp.]|nr:hypothetical protein [Dinoroseobacter sp.]